MKPAWSWQFEPGVLAVVEPDLPAPVTAEWAWGGATGAGVKVAVIDSGIEANHPAVGDVAGWVAFEHDPEAEGGVRVVEGFHEDVFGHGTACAAIIRRVAPEAELFSVRVLGGNLKTRGFVFAAGLRWAIENEMRVVNMSLSTNSREHFAHLHELTDRAYFRHMMLVSAINNAPGPSYPSEYSSVLSVAAHGGTDPFVFDYNPSPPVEFGAPGIDVEVAWRGGGTIRASGNSFAAAHLTGIVARILGKHPATTPSQMKAFLQALAANASGPRGGSHGVR